MNWDLIGLKRDAWSAGLKFVPVKSSGVTDGGTRCPETGATPSKNDHNSFATTLGKLTRASVIEGPKISNWWRPKAAISEIVKNGPIFSRHGWVNIFVFFFSHPPPPTPALASQPFFGQNRGPIDGGKLPALITGLA
jgi:hypothetical protein